MQLTVRPIAAEDIERITRYWMDSDSDYLISLGVDIGKLPSEEEWNQMLT
jgi:[ribosomal protein S5]-alanine N-acetyltransferase